MHFRPGCDFCCAYARCRAYIINRRGVQEGRSHYSCYYHKDRMISQIGVPRSGNEVKTEELN